MRSAILMTKQLSPGDDFHVSRHLKIAWMVLSALILSACGSPRGPMTDFIKQHTQCQSLDYGNPQWSPDGALIYYNVFVTNSVDLHVMTSAGGNDKLLASNANTALLSPDGSMVLFDRPNPSSLQAYDEYLLDLKTLKVRPLNIIGAHPSWSPDSQWFVYSTPMNAISALYKLNVAAGHVTRLTDGLYFDDQPLWSPGLNGAGDDQRIAFMSDRDGDRNAFYLLNADDANIISVAAPQSLACIAPSIDRGYRPLAWRPDGQALAIWHACDWNVTLHVVTIDGKEIADLSALGSDIQAAQWSPDGKHILYSGGNPKTGGLSVVSADGSGTVLLQSKAVDGRWSPDGKRIVFVGMDSAGLPEIFTVNPDGTGLLQITDNPGNGHICLH